MAVKVAEESENRRMKLIQLEAANVLLIKQKGAAVVDVEQMRSQLDETNVALQDCQEHSKLLEYQLRYKDRSNKEMLGHFEAAGAELVKAMVKAGSMMKPSKVTMKGILELCQSVHLKISLEDAESKFVCYIIFDFVESCCISFSCL